MNLGNTLAAAAAAVAFVVAAPPSALADTVIGDFTIDNGVSVASGGQVTFTLNANGTIAASLTDTSGAAIFGFGFDSVAINLAESNFSPTAPDDAKGWFDEYGYHPSGFSCSRCGTSETWTIGNPGEFTSVLQALGGGNSSYDFFLYDSNGDQWAADAVAAPEPATWTLMLTGLAAMGAMLRRRAKAAAA